MAYITLNYSMIIPAAGLGTRLGLPYAKELHAIAKGKSLIDLSIDAAVKSFGIPSEIVLVSRSAKESLNCYVRDRGFELGSRVICVENNNLAKEYTHSIELGAAEATLPLKLLVLPDAYIEFPACAKQVVSANMAAGKSTLFYKSVEDRVKEVFSKGAIDISPTGYWYKYHDKPVNLGSNESYCGYWTGFFFYDPKDVVIKQFCNITSSQEKISNGETELDFFDSFGVSIQVEEYIDLGEWEALHSFSHRYIKTFDAE